MATHNLKVKVHGFEIEVEVSDTPDKKGLSGYYYNYRFIMKQHQDKSWRVIVYRPGEHASCKSFKDKPAVQLATQALEFIVKDYTSRSKPKHNNEKHNCYAS